jgi:hypothetical protein
VFSYTRMLALGALIAMFAWFVAGPVRQAVAEVAEWRAGWNGKAGRHG